MMLDSYDKLILEALQKDGRISNVQLAGPGEPVGVGLLAAGSGARGIRHDRRYAALISQNEAGLPGNVFVQIGLQREVESDLAAFEEAVRDIPEVMECYLMSGEFDYLIRVVVADMADFERMHKDPTDAPARRRPGQLEFRDPDGAAKNRTAVALESGYGLLCRKPGRVSRDSGRHVPAHPCEHNPTHL